MARRRPSTILVADDDVTYGEALEMLLRADGHEVIRVVDGIAALSALAEHGDRINLFLCDLLLPRKSGFDVIKDMNAWDKAVPVLAMTGVYESFREIHALRGLGIAGYVHKSAPFEHLLFRVNTLVFPAEGNTRRDPRVAAAVPVQVGVDDRVFHSTTYNVSASGVYVRTNEPIEAGTVVSLALALPSAREMVRLDAEVVHSASAEQVRGTAYPAGFGARFVDPSPLAHAAMRHFVDLVVSEQSGEHRAVTDRVAAER